jgi:23S rRNA (cytosine1962-C5)-methyltransferase
MRIERHLGQPIDHPVPLHFPEAEYLKGLLLRAD